MLFDLVTLEQQLDQGAVDALNPTRWWTANRVRSDQGQVQTHGFTEAISEKDRVDSSFMSDRVRLQD